MRRASITIIALLTILVLGGTMWMFVKRAPQIELTTGEDSIPYLAAYSPDYQTARKKFREAATIAGATYEFHRIEEIGAKGESLTIDVARIGSDSPSWTVVISSGIHGVEGPFGSAVQLAWLHSFANSGRLSRDGAIVLIHAINPYGFSWSRRTDENNVDLNRNYRRPDLEYTTNSNYAALDSFLNPASPPSRYEFFRIKSLWKILTHGGMGALKAAIATGQYDFTQGLFYGGAAAGQTTRIVQENFNRWTGNAPRIVHLDFHTGLGEYGSYKALVLPKQGSAEFDWYENHFGGAVESMQKEEDATAYPAKGVIGDWATYRFDASEYRYIAPEFGTYSPIRVLEALRTENRAHFHSSPDESTYQNAKQNLRETFCPPDPVWRRQTVHEALGIIEIAINAAQTMTKSQKSQ